MKLIVGQKIIQKTLGKINFEFFEWRGLVHDRSMVKQIIQQAKIYLLTSEVEGMPNGLMEAMALGMPCIATNVGAVSEIIEEGTNGFIVDSADYKSLSQKIMMLLDREDLQESIGKSARETMVRHFSWESNIRRVENCYENVLQLK